MPTRRFETTAEHLFEPLADSRCHRSDAPHAHLRERAVRERRDWLAVACAEHVARGVADGFMQVCHGKERPLRRLHAGDRVAYYSPGRHMGGPADLKSVTAFGVVADDQVEQIDMGGGFRHWRRRVRWISDRRVPIGLLQADPAFTLSGPGWGAKLRFGLLRLDTASMDLIANCATGGTTEMVLS